jgi:hypothetical protein
MSFQNSAGELKSVNLCFRAMTEMERVVALADVKVAFGRIS